MAPSGSLEGYRVPGKTGNSVTAGIRVLLAELKEIEWDFWHEFNVKNLSGICVDFLSVFCLCWSPL